MKTMTYILNLTLLVVCTQFAFAADNADTGGKQMYVSFEDAQAALPDKEYAQDQSHGDSNGSRSAPDWEDDPGAYEFVSTIVAGIVQQDGQNIGGGEGDLFAAFDADGNVRGLSLPSQLLIPEFGPYAGTAVYEMTMRSNAAGDILSFQFYDSSEDAILSISETYEFVINDVIGDVINPWALHIQTTIDLGIDRFSGRRTSGPIRDHNEATSASRCMRTHRRLQRDHLSLISGPVTG